MLLDEAHSSLDVCANCGCGQYSLAVLSRDSWAKPRPPTHWRRLCALIWSCCSPVLRTLSWLAGGSSTCTLHEHAQMIGGIMAI